MNRDHDVVIVGASLAGATAAMLLARAGASVLLADQRLDPDAFKRVCGHYIQASAVPTLERAGLLEPMMAAGAVRSHGRLRTRYGWTLMPEDERLERSVNLRREKLDPLVRRIAADTPGVELALGRTARDLVCEDGRIVGVELEGRDGERTTVRAKLVVGADGRDSKVARMAGVRERKSRNDRFSYGVYYEGPPPAGAPNGSVWLNEPDAPPIRESRAVSSAIGKLDMPNVARDPVAPGLALVGDAALAADPLWGVGCGWAFQSAEWLAESVAPALRGEGSLDRGLRRYRRRHRRALGFHDRMINDFSRARPLAPPERLLFSAATRDQHVAEILSAYGTRSISPLRMIATAMPRALLVNARYRPRQFAGRFSAKARTPSLKSSEAKQA